MSIVSILAKRAQDQVSLKDAQSLGRFFLSLKLIRSPILLLFDYQDPISGPWLAVAWCIEFVRDITVQSFLLPSFGHLGVGGQSNSSQNI